MSFPYNSANQIMPNVTNRKLQGSPSYSVLEAAGEFSMLTLMAILMLGEQLIQNWRIGAEFP